MKLINIKSIFANLSATSVETNRSIKTYKQAQSGSGIIIAKTICVLTVSIIITYYYFFNNDIKKLPPITHIPSITVTSRNLDMKIDSSSPLIKIK